MLSLRDRLVCSTSFIIVTVEMIRSVIAFFDSLAAELFNVLIVAMLCKVLYFSWKYYSTYS